MIPFDKELEVHEALDSRNGRSLQAIANEIGVPKTTVLRISTAREKSRSVPEETFFEVRSLLLSGLSAATVSARTGIEKDVVVAIRRVTCAQLRRSEIEPRKCPTCGSPVLPDCVVDHIPSDPPESFDRDYVVALFKIADDMVGLGCANVIHNFLFLDLVKRSRDVVNEITGGGNG